MPVKINLKEGEQLDDLLIDGRKIIQNKNLYMFTSDSVKLSNFAKLKKGSDVCELCSGSGIIGILLAITKNPKSVVMVELQKALAEMCEKSIKLNGLEDKITVVNKKLQGINKVIGAEKFHTVICNPPFEKTIVKAKNESSVIARCEKEVTLYEICKEAGVLLKFGGSFQTVIPAERIFELSNYLKEFNMAIKEVEFEFDKYNKARIALVKAVKGGADCAIIKLSGK